MSFADIVDRLIAAYRLRTPDFGALEARLIADGAIAERADALNDHIAFRTFGVPNLNIAALEPLFVQHGYVCRDAFHFPVKHLDAFWFAPPDDRLPRIFVSELRLEDLSEVAARTIRRYTDVRTTPLFSDVDLSDPASVVAVLEARLWPLPTLADYRTLAVESEYAAWTIVNGFALNHLTLSVHGLRADLQSVGALNGYLMQRGFALNVSGGAIKVSPDGLLLQSSTLARQTSMAFADGGEADVAGPYIEFAERRVRPEFAHLAPADVRREHRRDGFEAANADRIFESTNLSRNA